MKFKKTLLAFCLIMCIFFCVSSVVAGDVNETVTANEDEQQTIQETNEEIDINNGERLLSTNDNVVEQISQNDNDILSYSVQVSSYSDLVNKIEQAKTTNYANYTINLENKKYTATKDVIEWGPSGDTSGTKTLIIEGNGATLDGDNKYSFMYVNRDYTLILNNIKIINFAKFETSGFVDKIYGGAIFVDTLGSLAVSNCEFENNYAKEGGAIYCDGILVIRKSIFTKNTADSRGGAINTCNGKCDIQTSLFESNNARIGGAIYSGVNGAIITNNIFTKNEAKKGGGAIHNGYWRETSYGTVIYDRWGNRIEGEREYFGLNTGIIKNTFAFNKAEYGAAVNNVVKSILIDSNNFYANSATSSASDVIVNNADNVEISNNVMKGTNYYSTISNSDSYSKISNNIFDNAPSTIFTIPDAGTYKTSTATDSVNGYSITNVGDTAKTYSDSKVSATFLDRNGKALANTKVTFKVGGKSFSATTNSKGVATAIIDLGVGTYDVTAVNPSTKEEKQFKLTIDKATPEFTLKASKSDLPITADGKPVVTITATFSPNTVTGKVTVSSEGSMSYYGTITNGQAVVTTFYASNVAYDVIVSYSGDNNFKAVEKAYSFNVSNAKPVLTAESISFVYGNAKDIIINLNDDDGTPIADKDISLKIYIGADRYYSYSGQSDENGQLKVSTKGLGPNNYLAYINSEGCKEITAKITVKKATPKLTAKAKTFKKSVKTKKYTITLKTNKNKVMKNTKVTLKVNGKTYSAKTNAKGQATFKITKLTKKGKFTAVVKFAGNKYYNAKTVKVKITVK